MLARDKHSSLLRKSVNYDRKKFYRIDHRPWNEYIKIQKGKKSIVLPGNTKGGSITVPLTSCLTGLD
jgi:hypothetical protein